MDEKETLGKYLKNQRESRKISLREVSKNTRVREHILGAIEEDRLDLLPPATYVKGFLLAYARYLRLDPNEVLLRYEKALTREPAAPTVPPAPQPLRRRQEIPLTQPSKPRQKAWWNASHVWVVVGVIVASFTLFYFFFPYPPKPPSEPSPEGSVGGKPSVVPLSPSASTTHAPEQKPFVEEKKPLSSSLPVPTPVSSQEKKVLSLQLKAAEETWVSLQVDEQPEKEMTFKPGDGVSVQGSNRIRMKIGNAGGLDSTLNGRPLGKFGKSGEVVTLIITSQGVEVNPGRKVGASAPP